MWINKWNFQHRMPCLRHFNCCWEMYYCSVIWPEARFVKCSVPSADLLAVVVWLFNARFETSRTHLYTWCNWVWAYDRQTVPVTRTAAINVHLLAHWLKLGANGFENSQFYSTQHQWVSIKIAVSVCYLLYFRSKLSYHDLKFSIKLSKAVLLLQTDCFNKAWMTVFAFGVRIRFIAYLAGNEDARWFW